MHWLRRRRSDRSAAALPLGRIVEFELDFLFGVERRQIVEIDAVPQPVRLFEIDAVDLDQREIALAIPRRADLALEGDHEHAPVGHCGRRRAQRSHLALPHLLAARGRSAQY